MSDDENESFKEQWESVSMMKLNCKLDYINSHYGRTVWLLIDGDKVLDEDYLKKLGWKKYGLDGLYESPTIICVESNASILNKVCKYILTKACKNIKIISAYSAINCQFLEEKYLEN